MILCIQVIVLWWGLFYIEGYYHEVYYIFLLLHNISGFFDRIEAKQVVESTWKGWTVLDAARCYILGKLDAYVYIFVSYQLSIICLFGYEVKFIVWY